MSRLTVGLQQMADALSEAAEREVRLKQRAEAAEAAVEATSLLEKARREDAASDLKTVL